MNASGLKVEVADGEINRYRPMVIIADDNMTGSSGYQRGVWEMKRNNAEAKRATATVQGWQKPDGSLWLPNELVVIDAPQLGLNKEVRLIVEVNFTLDENGTMTQLTLMHRDAFDEPAQDLKSKKGKKGSKGKKGKGNASEFDGFTQE